ncbi:MAG TPA: prolipoprotein diacylglyceryl transferase [Candidatus Dormibacteraeota bacterium]|nr:prolipoprotein diacylglyceryl transferase [Candidatus Dormibacteraeota bacterium]
MIPIVGVIKIGIDPVFHLGPLSVHWYGVGYAVAILVGLQVALPYAERHGIPRGKSGLIAFWTVILALIGGRLFYDLQSGAAYYFTHPLETFAVWQGGMAFFGAIFLGSATLLFMAWREKVNFWVLLDAAVLFACVGQPIGRIGNIINGDILGYPSNLPWATAYTNPNSFAPRLGVGYQPAAAYEAVVILLALVLLLWLRHRGVADGVIGIVYLIIYPITQFGIFFLRNPVNVPIIAFGLKQTQLTSIGVLVLGAPLLIFAWRRTHRPREPSAIAAPEPPLA